MQFGLKYYSYDDYWDVHAGYHAYVSRKIARIENFTNDKVVKFYIPKGAKYYLSNDGQIVSNKIKSGDLKSQ